MPGALLDDRASMGADQLGRTAPGQRKGLAATAVRVRLGNLLMLFYGAHGSEVVAVGGGAAGAEDPAALAVLVVERVREAFEGVQVDGGFQLDRAVQEGGRQAG